MPRFAAILAAAAACCAPAAARRLTDAEQRSFYGYAYASAPTRALPVPRDAAQSLKEAAAAAGIYIGAAVNYGGMHDGSQGTRYPATALTQFSLWTAENECKVGPIHPQPATYAFAQCDYLAAGAVANSSVFRMHNVCWHEENPAWLNDMTGAAALAAALQQHIGNVTAHYLADPAKAYYALDVVNEAISDSGSSLLKPAVPWYPALPDYVQVAFTAAAAANAAAGSKALLCYNEYGAEGYSSPKAKKVIELVTSLKAAGIPVNCVGLQMHISVDGYPSGADIAENIRQLGLLGMTVHITEMDVKCSNCNAARLAVQAQVYTEVLEACLANKNCASFETWGIYDGDTWVGTENAPLLFDANWAPKPAYNAVLATLQAHAQTRRS